MGGPDISKRAGLVLFRVLIEPVIEALMVAVQWSLPVPHFDTPRLAVKSQ